MCSGCSGRTGCGREGQQVGPVLVPPAHRNASVACYNANLPRHDLIEISRARSVVQDCDRYAVVVHATRGCRQVCRSVWCSEILFRGTHATRLLHSQQGLVAARKLGWARTRVAPTMAQVYLHIFRSRLRTPLVVPWPSCEDAQYRLHVTRAAARAAPRKAIGMTSSNIAQQAALGKRMQPHGRSRRLAAKLRLAD
jgi:hypothetical protein